MLMRFTDNPYQNKASFEIINISKIASEMAVTTLGYFPGHSVKF